ncbi:MAG TPA: acyl-CoA dehydrogenase family protein [Mycobacteriales bacterium]|jgi:alkylation response protein AidB-like acyl-CoA dehydrogenase|nr:acyl-CoA dehydrogenase family protein [Mycobacteriales bacterium]
MFELRLTDAERDFRDELREWLDRHLVGDFVRYKGAGGVCDDSHWEVRLDWERKLAADRWLNITWPVEYGGRGGTKNQEIIFQIEHARAEAPYWVGVHGRDLFGPTLLEYGTTEQKARFLPAIARADEFWGQGFSEPGAGSDLASLSTSAVRDGDEWVINGQKIWMTFGAYADWLYVLCRTNRDAPKHAGISMLLVPADQPGVDVRPIRNIAGGREFCEVFFTDARTAKGLVVGEVDGAWRTVMATLGNERGGTTILPYQASFSRELRQTVALAHDRGLTDDPVMRQRLAAAYEGLYVLDCLSRRNVETALGSGHPGPESSIQKIYWSRWHRDFGELMMDVRGPAGSVVGDDYTLDLMQASFLNARAETIYGGTEQIQHTIVGERVLGLPREPR